MKREPPDPTTPAGQGRASPPLRPVVTYDDRQPDLEAIPTVTDFPLPSAEPVAWVQEALPSPAARSARSLFWPGFAASFLLLSLLSVWGLAMATGLDRIDLQNTGPVWQPPLGTPVAEAVVEASAASASTTGGTFQPGELVRILTDSRLRRTPGAQGKNNATDVVTVGRAGNTYEIIDGPRVADNLNWWYVRYTARDGQIAEGWAAETSRSGLQILGRQ